MTEKRRRAILIGTLIAIGIGVPLLVVMFVLFRPSVEFADPTPTEAPTAVQAPVDATDTPIPATEVPPTAEPSATLTPAPTLASTEVVTYVVKAGDVLGAIALEYDVTQDALMAANDIEDPDLIYVGQVLTIPVTLETPTPDVTVSPEGALTTTPTVTDTAAVPASRVLAWARATYTVNGEQRVQVLRRLDGGPEAGMWMVVLSLGAGVRQVDLAAEDGLLYGRPATTFW